jgi:hypothetical protein
MAMTPEGKVKDRVKKQLDALGAYHFMPTTGGYGRSGIPDIIGCLNGLFFAIECKGKSGTTTALQNRELAKIHLAGGRPLVINESNVEGLETLLRSKQ